MKIPVYWRFRDNTQPLGWLELPDDNKESIIAVKMLSEGKVSIQPKITIFRKKGQVEKAEVPSLSFVMNDKRLWWKK
jgi:hypothetical protein